MEVVADLDYPCVIVSGCLIYLTLEVHITIKHNLKENVLNK